MYSKVKSNELGLNDVQTAKNSTLEVSKPILHCDREAFNRLEMNLDNLDKLSQVGCHPNPSQSRFS